MNHDQCPAHLRLLEDAVDPEHVVEHLVEEHERHVQLLLVEHLQPSLHVAPQLLPVTRWKLSKGPAAEKQSVTISHWW